MSIKNRKNISKADIQKAILKTSTMGGAAKSLRVDWRTFKWNAEAHGLYEACAAGGKQKFKLQDILDGKHPQYPTSKLSKRLVKEGIKEYKCEGCGLDKWCGKTLPLELNHKDGDNSNHHLDNLELLCANCHSQTPTFRNKRGSKR